MDAVKVAPVTRHKPGANGVKPGIDAEKRTWTSQGGHTFTLKRVSWGAMQRIMSDPKGKPSVPVVTVNYGDGHMGTEFNPDDPTYKQQYADWQAENQHRSMLYCLGNGVLVDVPQAYKDEQLEDFPDATEKDLRYYYLTSLIDPDDLNGLVQAILSQNSPTEAGIAEAEATFPSDRE